MRALVVDDVEVEGGECVSLVADGACLVLSTVFRAALADLQLVCGALHRELVPRRTFVDRLAVLQPLQLERWLKTRNVLNIRVNSYLTLVLSLRLD